MIFHKNIDLVCIYIWRYGYFLHERILNFRIFLNMLISKPAVVLNQKEQSIFRILKRIQNWLYCIISFLKLQSKNTIHFYFSCVSIISFPNYYMQKRSLICVQISTATKREYKFSFRKVLLNATFFSLFTSNCFCITLRFYFIYFK